MTESLAATPRLEKDGAVAVMSLGAGENRFNLVARLGRLGPAKGKDFDTGNVLGPWIVTADELGDPHRLTMVARARGCLLCMCAVIASLTLSAIVACRSANASTRE